MTPQPRTPKPSRPGEVAANRSRESALLRFLLAPSVFLSGAVVLVLEVLGTRVIGPIYGTSLHVWSALISVTLISLAVGYWLGGKLADRQPSAARFYLLFDAAALLIALVPVLRRPVFDLVRPMGLGVGSLTAAALLFAAPLTVLGMISPFAVRLAAQVVDTVGRTAGRLYAISTAGSLVGTLVTAFVLIPNLKVRVILLASAAALLVPAAIYQLAARSWQVLGSALVLAAVSGSILTPPSGVPGVLHVRDSFFGQVKVIEGGGVQALLLNGATQTVITSGTRDGIISYPYVVADAAWRAAPAGSRALIVGLGGGLLPQILASWKVESVVVEIDPVVVEVARDYFGFDPGRSRVVTADGRRFLDSTRERYDYVILDAFAGEMVPAHMLTREMMSIIDERLAPGGVVILNYVGYRQGDRARPLCSIVRTMGERWPWVRVIACGSPGDYGNNVVVAGRTPVALPAGTAPFAVPGAIAGEFGAAHEYRPEGPAIVLTDDYNPLDLWALPGHEEWRKEMLAWVPWEMMLAD
jgi:spermidine synthase